MHEVHRHERAHRPPAVVGIPPLPFRSFVPLRCSADPTPPSRLNASSGSSRFVPTARRYTDRSILNAQERKRDHQTWRRRRRRGSATVAECSGGAGVGETPASRLARSLALASARGAAPRAKSRIRRPRARISVKFSLLRSNSNRNFYDVMQMYESPRASHVWI